jgi:hypothetical protein
MDIFMICIVIGTGIMVVDIAHSIISGRRRGLAMGGGGSMQLYFHGDYHVRSNIAK